MYTHTHTTKRSYPGHFNADINTSLCHSHDTTSVFLQRTINFNSMQVCGVGIKAIDVGALKQLTIPVNTYSLRQGGYVFP